MNIYFLVEGNEKSIFPEWFKTLLPGYTQISHPADADANNFYIISGGGYPSLLDDVLDGAIDDINQFGKYSRLIICIDSDESTVLERRNEVIEKIEEKTIALNDNCKPEIVVENRCFETWMLGNKDYYKKSLDNEKFETYQKHYNVSKSDPELMVVPTFELKYKSIGKFHKNYLKLMIANYMELLGRKHKIGKYPKITQTPEYLSGIISRTNSEKDHLNSFRYFREILNKIHQIT
ncbi:MAG: hypothetical protein KAH48_07925 [Chlorobi bacterium]|nr:hypothetical protein [Chlorobiota bacterium]